jgi:exonuclease SbcD
VVAATTGAVEAPQAVGDRLSALLRGFAPINDAARAAGVATVGVSHGTVFGCLSEHGVPMAGFDHEFTTGALFAAHAQAFLLGHIHRHQGWRQDGQHGSQAIAYAGSIGRFHHGEEGDKGFLLWTVEPCAAAYRLEPTPARRTIDITFEGRPDLKRIEEVVAEQEICGASVRVRWTVADEDRGTVDRAAIEALLSGAADVRLEGRIVPVARQRAAGVSRLSSLADKVRAWCRVADVSPAPMLSCLNTIEAVEPEAIAERVLRSEVGEGTASVPEPCEVAPLAVGH